MLGIEHDETEIVREREREETQQTVAEQKRTKETPGARAPQPLSHGLSQRLLSVVVVVVVVW